MTKPVSSGIVLGPYTDSSQLSLGLIEQMWERDPAGAEAAAYTRAVQLADWLASPSSARKGANDDVSHAATCVYRVLVYWLACWGRPDLVQRLVEKRSPKRPPRENYMRQPSASAVKPLSSTKPPAPPAKPVAVVVPIRKPAAPAVAAHRVLVSVRRTQP